MMPSPTPISACTPSIGGSTVPSGTGPDSASSSEHAAAPAITASHAPPADTASSTPRRRGSTDRAASISPPTTSAPMTPMLRTFAPSAVTPPSANTNDCTTSTTDMTTQASHGPSRIAASAAPRKWPLVPPATGKLSICTANTNAAVTPSSGTRRSSRSRLARRRPYATAATAGTAHAAATSGARNPSGMCTTALRTASDDGEVHELRLVAARLAQHRRDLGDGVVVERAVGAAVLARDVAGLMWGGERVQARSVRDVEVAHEADLLERVEVAIDR